MRNLIKFGALTAALAGAAIFAPTTASAGVMSVAGKATVAQSSLVDQVYYRCHRPWRHHWRYSSCHRHWGYYGGCHRWGYYPWRYRYSYYPAYGYGYGYRPSYYGAYGSSWYNPGAAVAGTALGLAGLATSPLWW